MTVDPAVMSNLYNRLGVSSTEVEPTSVPEDPSMAAQAYEQYEELPLLQQLGLAVAPGTGHAIAAYETPMFAGETKEALEEGNIPRALGQGALTGLSALGMIPGLGLGIRSVKAGVKAATKGLKKIDTEKIIDEVGESTQNIIENIVPPKKTKKAYKLFKQDKEGGLHPLYVDHLDGAPLPLNKWVKAEAGKIDPKTGKVKGSGGDLAYRPGFHSGDMPMATHIGGRVNPKTGERWKAKKGEKRNPNIREDNQVWAEVEVADDFDWQSVANSRAGVVKSGPRKGKLKVNEAHITDELPFEGHYRYKTNPNMTGNWLISGEVKINKVLDDVEVKKINDVAGVSDLPKLSELLEQSKPKIKRTRTRPQDRDYPTTRLGDKLSDNKTIQFLENNGYTEYTPGLSTNKADTWEYTDKGIRAYSSWVGPGGTEGISQRTFNNPTLKSIRSWMGYKQGGSIVERNPYTHNMKAI